MGSNPRSARCIDARLFGYAARRAGRVILAGSATSSGIAARSPRERLRVLAAEPPTLDLIIWYSNERPAAAWDNPR